MLNEKPARQRRSEIGGGSRSNPEPAAGEKGNARSLIFSQIMRSLHPKGISRGGG
jgi:hypothetical protein